MIIRETDMANIEIEKGAKAALSHAGIIKNEIDEFLISEQRKLMIIGQRYYLNHSDIEKKSRVLSNGLPIKNRSNVKLEHGFVRKLVDQKVGYLLAKLPSVSPCGEKGEELLERMSRDVLDREFWRMLKQVGKEAINKGIGWVQLYFENGVLRFCLVPTEEVIPLWADGGHTLLDGIIRVYDIVVYEGKKKSSMTKAEYWSKDGVEYYIVDKENLVCDYERSENEVNPHFYINGEGYNWDGVPFVPFRYNDSEQPIIDTIKSLVDNYNYQTSVNADMLADLPKFVYKLIGYGGTDLGEFVSDLQQYMAVKLQSDGDVQKLESSPNTEAVESVIKFARKDIYEFGRGVDSQSEHFGSASGEALKFRFADLDMDCNIMESEFQYSIELLMRFIRQYYKMLGTDFCNGSINVTFNRDHIISEREVIENCKNSVGILPMRQIRENHPWSNGETEEYMDI